MIYQNVRNICKSVITLNSFTKNYLDTCTWCVQFYKRKECTRLKLERKFIMKNVANFAVNYQKIDQIPQIDFSRICFSCSRKRHRGYLLFWGENKYISSNVMKISVKSRVHSTSEFSDIFNTWDEIFLVFTEKKVNFPFIFSSPEHKVLKVSYCDHPVSGARRQSSVVRRVSSTIHSKYISS